METLFESPKYLVWPEFILTLFSCVGLLLNFKVAKVVFKSNLAPDVIIMRLIVLFDIVACLVTLPYQYLRLSHSLEAYTCYLDIAFFSTSTFASLTATTALSLLRYITLICGREVHWKSALTWTSVYILAIWLVIVIRASIQPLGVMPSGMYCMPYSLNPSALVITFDTLYAVLLLPCPFIIFFSYVAVSIRYFRILDDHQQQALSRACGDLSGSPTIAKQIQASYIHEQTSQYRKNLFKLIMVLISYSVCALPEYTLSFVSIIFQVYRTVWMDYLSFLTLFTLSIINPIFVLHTHESRPGKTSHLVLQQNV